MKPWTALGSSTLIAWTLIMVLVGDGTYTLLEALLLPSDKLRYSRLEDLKVLITLGTALLLGVSAFSFYKAIKSERNPK
jgi:hypothetical protein